MLTMIMVILSTYGLSLTLNMKPTLEFLPGIKLSATLLVITTLLFWGLHLALTKREFDEYEKIWNEPEIKVFNIIYLIPSTIILWKLVTSSSYFFWETKILWLILMVLDITGIFVAYNTYSFKVKESVVDALLLQVRNVRASVLILMLLVIINKFTIMGVLLLFVVCVTIPGVLKFIKEFFFG